ncbi:MAG: hypothetical protein AABX47_01000 [Nanoarchaeota archaeon]
MTKQCQICKNKSTSPTCKNCDYLLKNGASEETIKKMAGDERVNKIWAENKTIAQSLADTYYPSVVENYKKPAEGDSKENYGYNTFTDGINMALDIAMPLLDIDSQELIKAKITSMIETRKELEKKKRR